MPKAWVKTKLTYYSPPFDWELVYTMDLTKQRLHFFPSPDRPSPLSLPLSMLMIKPVADKEEKKIKKV